MDTFAVSVAIFGKRPHPAVPESRFLDLDAEVLAAQSRIASMRPRSRLAVSGLVDQIGSSALRTRAVSISRTGSAPNAGLA